MQAGTSNNKRRNIRHLAAFAALVEVLHPEMLTENGQQMADRLLGQWRKASYLVKRLERMAASTTDRVVAHDLRELLSEFKGGIMDSLGEEATDTDAALVEALAALEDVAYRINAMPLDGEESESSESEQLDALFWRHVDSRRKRPPRPLSASQQRRG